MIKYKDFEKLDLRVGKIIEAEKIPNSKKLLKLIIDLGNEKRQIVAGIAKMYDPESLINKNVIVLVNITPVKLAGVESKGMLLATDSSLITTDKETPLGEKVR